MSVSKEQAMNAQHRQEFHYGECTVYNGPKGGKRFNRYVVRVTGLCKTWKTRPEEFSLPIRHGLYRSGAITHWNNNEFHSAQDCPLDA